jgi:hypothetical protein
VYVAELTIDDKKVIAQGKAKLNYGGKARSRKSVVKMALLLNDVETDAWVCHDNKLFSFHDIEQCGLISVVDAGSVERLNISDLADSAETDNVNILKQLLSAETRELLKQRHVRMHNMDGFFFFGPTEEGQLERRETWIGKRTAIRRVFEVKYQRKDPSKVAHQKHFSFDLTSRSWGTTGMRRLCRVGTILMTATANRAGTMNCCRRRSVLSTTQPSETWFVSWPISCPAPARKMTRTTGCASSPSLNSTLRMPERQSQSVTTRKISKWREELRHEAHDTT